MRGGREHLTATLLTKKKSGVKRYRIYRPTDDEKFVVIDLEFDNLEQAQAAQTALQNIFPKIEGSIVFSPQLKILNIIEDSEL